MVVISGTIYLLIHGQFLTWSRSVEQYSSSYTDKHTQPGAALVWCNSDQWVAGSNPLRAFFQWSNILSTQASVLKEHTAGLGTSELAWWTFDQWVAGPNPPGLPTFQNAKEGYFEEFLPKKRNAYALTLQI